MINDFKVNWLMKKIAEGHLQDCLDIVFQPLMEIGGSHCVGAEILIRGIYANETITPDKFINLSEGNGSISDIDLFCFRSGVQFICDNYLLAQRQFRFSFNFSPCSFNRPDFAALICKDISRDIARSIILEITESNIPLNNYAIRNAVRLREYGFRIAWDDIDSLGYAFRTLQYFKFDFAKLDKSLLANNRPSLIKNIISVYHDFNTEVIVEGVEEPAQLSLLRQMNVKYVQGFLFSAPVSKSEFIDKYIFTPLKVTLR
ncbi:EAL domain-containing protein [Atlantibacter hermannii]|uniref:EAL domain-containing protein n=1 Tax=Atlantibacter hermannii TaxID=565 RepID=UPI001933921F|nr:EAL domain-containing protein [Atlantibacter hermannii]MBL7636510.1 EAL domain-containing protein [Atlantibacter hermannii]MBL7675748.1 EAL domain-containing protein [Atlantibacter hermannii]